MENELDKAKLELINLYLNIKIRTQDEVNSLTEKNLLLETEKYLWTSFIRYNRIYQINNRYNGINTSRFEDK